MSSSNVIVFFDIPGESFQKKAWSPTTWRTRFALNYKGLKYRTEWIEYPDIEAICKKYDAPPTSQVFPYYTLPMIYDPSTKTAVVDSPNIARYLDRTYPDTPQLFPPGTAALQAAFLDAIPMNIVVPLFLNVVPKVWGGLPPRSKVYFRETREKMLGKKLEALGGENLWEECHAAFGKLDAWLKAEDESKEEIMFLGDDTPNACDLTTAATLIWAKFVCGPDSEEWRRISSWHSGRWGRFEKYFQSYAYIDDDGEA